MALFGKRKNVNRRVAQAEDASLTVLSENSAWPVQEAYKALRTNITFSLPGSGCRVIGFTSAFASDGKSINAINTAVSFAQLGKHVLLIDCDMRLPTCAAKLEQKTSPGLSDVLVNQAELKEALIRKLPCGIDLLPAGSIPPDPTWLLQSEQMTVLLKELRKFYDWIFIDLPPVTTVADAAILSQSIDGFLLVVRHEQTDKRAIADMMGHLKMAGSKIIGFIYNDYVAQGSRYYKSYYRKYYRKNGSKS